MTLKNSINQQSEVEYNNNHTTTSNPSLIRLIKGFCNRACARCCNTVLTVLTLTGNRDEPKWDVI